MDIFGIGFPELLLIFVIALMIFGPRRLPELAGKAGKVVRDLRNMSQGFMTEWQREITAAARLEEIEQARQELEKTRQELQQARSNLNISADVDNARASLAAAANALQEPKISPPPPEPASSPAPEIASAPPEPALPVDTLLPDTPVETVSPPAEVNPANPAAPAENGAPASSAEPAAPSIERTPSGSDPTAPPVPVKSSPEVADD